MAQNFFVNRSRLNYFWSLLNQNVHLFSGRVLLQNVTHSHDVVKTKTIDFITNNNREKVELIFLF